MVRKRAASRLFGENNMQRQLRHLARAGAVVWFLAWLALSSSAGASSSPLTRSPQAAPAVPAAPLEVLYDQTSTGSGQDWVSSTNFPPNLDLVDNQGADDVIVPTDKFWTISTVTVVGHYEGGAGAIANSVLVQFYANAPGNVPGSLVREQTIAGNQPSGTFVLSLPSPVTLGPGPHWVSVQANVNSSAPNFEQWAWHESNDLFMNPSVWRQPGNAYATGCTTFQPRIPVCHWPSTSDNPDLLFKLEGSSFDVVAKVLLPIMLR
jgi:hypothetical protein